VPRSYPFLPLQILRFSRTCFSASFPSGGWSGFFSLQARSCPPVFFDWLWGDFDLKFLFFSLGPSSFAFLLPSSLSAQGCFRCITPTYSVKCNSCGRACWHSMGFSPPSSHFWPAASLHVEEKVPVNPPSYSVWPVPPFLISVGFTLPSGPHRSWIPFNNPPAVSGRVLMFILPPLRSPPPPAWDFFF